MGNVGGRDVLRRLAAASLAIDEDADRGLAFVDYAGVGEIRPFFAAFHAALDALDLDEAAATRVVTEAEAGFRLNIDLTDELARDHGIA
jgi:heme oxygenase (biliverdin-producing, ferredoxin)